MEVEFLKKKNIWKIPDFLGINLVTQLMVHKLCGHRKLVFV
jgi:hypothetical protein